MIRVINEKDWQPKDHDFLEPKLIKSNQEVFELYALKVDSPTNNYLRFIDKHFNLINKQHQNMKSQLTMTSNTMNIFTTSTQRSNLWIIIPEGYIQDSEDSSSNNSQEYVHNSKKYVEEIAKSSPKSDKKDYPHLFMNQDKELEVSEAADDKDDMKDEPI